VSETDTQKAGLLNASCNLVRNTTTICQDRLGTNALKESTTKREGVYASPQRLSHCSRAK
jgi:hypothetical protein